MNLLNSAPTERYVIVRIDKHNGHVYVCNETIQYKHTEEEAAKLCNSLLPLMSEASDFYVMPYRTGICLKIQEELLRVKYEQNPDDRAIIN